MAKNTSSPSSSSDQTPEQIRIRELEAERDALRTALGRVRELMKEIERHCPCGARPESPRTHHHVIGCPVEAAISVLADPPVSPTREET